jgi:hypothetical protein
VGACWCKQDQPRSFVPSAGSPNTVTMKSNGFLSNIKKEPDYLESI